MADETVQTSDPTTGQPINITIAAPVAPPIVTPTPGMDVTQEGGAFRLQDGSYVDAEGRPLDKKPKDKA